MEFLRQTATADVVSNRIGFVPLSSSVGVNGFLDCSRREDAMGMHERWSGEYRVRHRSSTARTADVEWKQPRSEGCALRSASAIESTGLC